MSDDARISMTAFTLPPVEYGPVAVEAERLGYDTMWMPEHLIVPTGEWKSVYPYRPGARGLSFRTDTPMVDLWTTMGYLSAQTTRLKFASGVYILPMRNPFVTARAVATAQALSGGRVLVGMGAGWNREEFAAVGEDFDNRYERLDEIFDVLHLLWTGESVTYEGRWYQFDPVQMAPAPDPLPPLIVGGTSARLLSLAARKGDGWYSPPDASLDSCVEVRSRLEALFEQHDRDPQGFEYHVRLQGDLTVETVDRYRQAGFTNIVLNTARTWDPGPGAHRPLAEKLEILQELAAAVGLSAGATGGP